MAGSNYFRPVTILAAILGLVQSIIWFVLSLLGVLAYRCSLGKPVYNGTEDQFPVTLYILYYQGPDDDCKANDSYLQNGIEFNKLDLLEPAILHGWMAAYLAFDILYFIVSLWMFLYRNNNGQKLLYLVRGWCLNTFAFLIMDVWLTFEFGFDYQEVSQYLSDHSSAERFSWVTTIPGALMAIAARGFILWFLNLALLVYFMSYTVNWTKLCEPPAKERRELQGRDNNVVLNDPEFREILHAHRNKLPRASIDSWSSDRNRNDLAVVPVTHEFRRPPKPWETTAATRWEEYPTAHEGVTRFSTDDLRSFPPQKKQILWDSEPLPKPQLENKSRSYGPSADYRMNLKESLKSATERRQREAPISLDEDDQRVIRPNRGQDFNHDIKNFEAGHKRQSQQKEVKPFGQPVRVPPPPALPRNNNDSYYY